MVQVTHVPGVVLSFDEDAFELPTPHVMSRAPVGAAGSNSPVPLSAPPDSGLGKAVVDALVRHNVVRSAERPVVLRAASGATELRRSLARPTRLDVTVDAGEEAVVLTETDGVLAWHFPQQDGTQATPVQRRHARAAGPRVETFSIEASDAQPTVQLDARRGWLTDRIVGGVKAFVLRFAAQVAAGGIVSLLERSAKTGPVFIDSLTNPASWTRPQDFASVRRSAAPRILLLIHGTFSSTVGGFGGLTATPWGRQLLNGAIEAYDAVIGFDHRTLSDTPRQNAEALLATLRTLPSGKWEIDAVAHSRGGLVLRTLIEDLLPSSKLPLLVRRAVLVGATNAGTELARPANWESLVDLITNLTAVAGKAISLFPAAAPVAAATEEAVSIIGDFVKYLVQAAVEDRRAPGLAAMEPGGATEQELNATQSGQPSSADIDYFAIVSDFRARLKAGGSHEPSELPLRLAILLADGVVDRLMRGNKAESVANDLVVDVKSMTSVDLGVGGFVKDVLDFGTNASVYHTNYFLRPETAARIAQWLELPGVQVPLAEKPSGVPPLPSGRRGQVEEGVGLQLLSLEDLALSLHPKGQAPGPTARAPDEVPRRDRGTRSTGPVSPAPAPPPERAVLNAASQMPGTAELGSRVNVEVSLSREEIEAATDALVARGQFEADDRVGATLTIDVVPRRGFDYVPDDPDRGRHVVGVPVAGRQLTVAVPLVANEVGEGLVTVAIRQGPTQALAMTLRGKVTAAADAASVEATATGAMPPQGVAWPCPSLTVFDRRIGAGLQLEFILEGKDVYNRFTSPRLEIEPSAFVAEAYKEIEEAWTGSNRAIAAFEMRLAAWGASLFRNLFPQPLQTELWRMVQSSEIGGIRILSDEPFLPWEMVYVSDPGARTLTGGKFLAELGACRWLYGATAPTVVQVRPGHARYVIPEYPDPSWNLPWALNEERSYMDSIGAMPVEPPQHKEVMQMLRSAGEVDLLHFACHGSADSSSIDSSALWLQGEIIEQNGQAAWAKESLDARTVAAFANLRGSNGSRPLVFVNACQTGRAGRSLSGIGGFASAFIGTREGTDDSSGGAAAFVGALWSVGDEKAVTVTTVLYDELRKGKLMGQASQLARLAARKAGEPTWLAYTFYAHPLLRVRWV